MHTKCKFISDRKKWLESNEIKMMNLFNISGDSGYQLQSCVSWQCWALMMSRLSRTRQRCSCSDSLTSTLIEPIQPKRWIFACQGPDTAA